MRFHTSTFTILAAAITLTAAGVAAAAPESDSSAAAPEVGAVTLGEQPPAPVLDPVTAVDAATSRAFAVFRDTPAAPMPADAAAQVGSAERYGRNPKLARAISTPSGRGWVIPGRGYVCLAAPDPAGAAFGYGSTCQSTDVAAEDGISLEFVGPDPNGRRTVIAVAPTGGRVVAGRVGATTATVLPSASGVAGAVVDAGTVVEIATP